MRKLAHIRSPGYGLRTWSGARWFTPGPAHEITLLDVPEITAPTGMTRWTPNGMFVPKEIPCRPARLASFHMTNPAVFQSYFKTDFSDLFGARANLEEGARVLTSHGSPLAIGRAEGQAIMQYDPFPSAGEIYPKAL